MEGSNNIGKSGPLIQNLLRSLKKIWLVVPIIVALILFGFSQYSYLLFHTLSELFTVSIGTLMFAVAWSVYPYNRNNFLMFIASGYFWIAIIDLFHALSSKGMAIFPVYESASSIELWLSARYMESITLFIAPLFILRPVKRSTVFLSYMLATTVLGSMVVFDIFPHVFNEGVGLTPFKIYSEYAIILILAGAILHIIYQRRNITQFVFQLMVASIVLTIIAELAFTFYVSVYGLSNLVGHIFKVFSFWILFIAIIRTTLTEPYETLRNEIVIRKDTEKALTLSNYALRVLTRTNEAMVGATNEQYLLDNVCNIIIDTGKYSLAWIGYKDDDELQSLRCITTAGIDAEFLKHPHLTWAELEEGSFPPGRAIREARGVVIQDIITDIDCVPCHSDAKKYGFNSVIALPLFINFEVFGVLAIYARDKNAFALKEIDLLSDLASDISYAIEALRIRDDRKQVIETLSETEEKFRNLSEQALVGVYLIQDGVFQYVNPRFAELVGYELDEIIGNFKPQDLVFSDDWPTVRENLRKRFDGEVVSMHYEFRIVRKDQSIMDVEIYGSHSTYQGKPAILGTLLDITERKHAAEKLRASEGRLRTIIGAEPECVKMLDANGNLLDMNPAGLALLQADALDEVIGKPILHFVDKQYRDAFSKMSQDVFNGKSRKLEFEITGLKGEKHFMETNAVPIIEEGKVSSLLAISRDISQHKHAEQMLRDRAKETQRLLIQTIESVALTVEKRDPYTSGHQMRVAEIAVLIAREMALDEEQITGIHLGGIIHDIGKIYIPAEILNRPGRLTEAEFSMIKTHPQVGYDIMKGVEFPWAVNEIILQHHERMDGTGYPQGLKGEEIVIEARIIAVADVIEAISSHRPYRPALGIDIAIEEIQRGRGIIYDSDVVDAFMSLFENKKINL